METADPSNQERTGNSPRDLMMHLAATLANIYFITDAIAQRTCGNTPNEAEAQAFEADFNRNLASARNLPTEFGKPILPLAFDPVIPVRHACRKAADFRLTSLHVLLYRPTFMSSMPT